MKRLVLLALVILGSMHMSLYADMTDSLRQALPHLKGNARFQAYLKIYMISLKTDDVDYQLRCINDLIAEEKKQKKAKMLSRTLLERAVIFYNNDMSDSIFAYVPNDMETLKSYKDWDRFYEIWTHLANTYVFKGQYNMALREVQSMFDDAKSRNNKYGMGIAYYTMGNVYQNMHNLPESASSYRKGIDLLSDIRPLPSTLSDTYSYYGDVLNEMQDYAQLTQLTGEWKLFLEKLFAERQVSREMKAIAWSYYYVACVQAALGTGKLDEAQKMLDEVYKRIPSEADYVGLTWLFYCAQLNLQRGEYQEALKLNDRRMQLLQLDDDKSLYLQIASQRVDILRGLGKYQEAADIYKRIIQVKDSVNGMETRNQLNEMNTLFKVDELKMEQERAQFRNTLIIAGLIVLALVIFTIFRIRAARRLKKAHNELEKAHDDLLVAYDQLEETTTAKERIESDLRIARNIQMGMVPHNFPDRPDVDLYASMTPAKEVGGDLYGYYMAKDKLYFALGDVSGKGVPASLFMAQATRLFRTLAAREMMPAEIATSINNALSGEDNETGMFVTMFIGLVDLTNGHLDFCNAGHNPPVLIDGNKADFIEMVPNAPIGLWPELEYEGEEIADINDKPLFVYSDGLNEAENRQQEQFSDERLLEILQTVPFESSKQTIEMLKEMVEKHRDGADPNDDLTMLCVKVHKNGE